MSSSFAEWLGVSASNQLTAIVFNFMPQEYLGDSVYGLFDGCSFELTTRNGLPTDPSNTIILEPEVVIQLIRFVKRNNPKLIELAG